MKFQLKFLVLFLLPILVTSQTLQCDGTSLPDFYALYGGSTEFEKHTNDAINAFIDVEEAIASQNYTAAKNLINALFSAYPKGDDTWKRLFNNPKGANVGSPHAYYGLRMLEQIIDYQLNPSANPVIKTVNMKVVLVGCSKGIQPTTDAELQRGAGTFVTNQLDTGVTDNTYCVVEKSLDLFLKYINAISQGELQVNVEYVELPSLCLDFQINNAPPINSTPNLVPVWSALDDTVNKETDWFWVIYPSNVPEFPDFDDDAFITGGMGVDSKGGPVFISNDKWLLSKPAHLGSGMYNDIERRLYLPQWLQHEFFHHLYRIYPEFSLEVNGHDWFNLNFWPDDFNGQFESDFYTESLNKRLLHACDPLSNRLITRIDATRFDLTEAMVMNELLGEYGLDNVENPWQEGDIIFSEGSYFWKNKANIQWKVTPNLEEWMLETGPDSPYQGQDFFIKHYVNPEGELIPGAIGLLYQGGIHRKRFNMIQETTPFEATLDSYYNTCNTNDVNNGAIIKENGQFYWENNDNEMWQLTPSSEMEAFSLGADSPTPGDYFKFIVLQESCGLQVPGFVYKNNYYWRSKIHLNNPSPFLNNPIGYLQLSENFGTHSIDLSTIFSDIEGEQLLFYATSSNSNLLDATVNGNSLELTGAMTGIYSICLTAMDANRGLVTDNFTVQVQQALSTHEKTWASNLYIHPNPVKNLVYIEHAPSHFDVVIYNMHSSVLKSFSNLKDAASIDLNDLSAGVYFMKIISSINDTFVIKRIIKH